MNFLSILMLYLTYPDDQNLHVFAAAVEPQWHVVVLPWECAKSKIK